VRGDYVIPKGIRDLVVYLRMPWHYFSNGITFFSDVDSFSIAINF